MEIRRARPDDGPKICDLVLALAHYEKLPAPDPVALGRLVSDAFGADPRVELWVADDGHEPVAYAACFWTYSTFRALPGLYLEDLFVHPKARRRGVGTKLMQTLLAHARARGCGRLEWTVLDWNEPAQGFYDQLGAKALADWRLMRIDL